MSYSLNNERVVTVLGGTSVGKSALTNRFVNNKFPEIYEPTIAKTYKHKLNLNGHVYNLILHDTAGLEQQSQIPTRYIDQSQGFVLVYSITDYQSFNTVIDIYNKLSDDICGQKTPLVLIGNKLDLNEQRRVKYEEGKKLAEDWKADFLETSALRGDKVTDMFVTLLHAIDRQYNNNNNSNNNNNNNSNRSSNNPNNYSNQPNPNSLSPNNHQSNNSHPNNKSNSHSSDHQNGKNLCSIS